MDLLGDKITPAHISDNPYLCMGGHGLFNDVKDIGFSRTSAKHVPQLKYQPQIMPHCNAPVDVVVYGNDGEPHLFSHDGPVKDNPELKALAEKRKAKIYKRSPKPSVYVGGPGKTPAASATAPESKPGHNAGYKTKALTVQEQCMSEKEIELSEMREEHHKQSAAMNELENNIKQLNGELLSDLKVQLSENGQKLVELQQLLTRREEEITALTDFDDETAKSKMSRQIRDLESRVQEINKDLDTEKQAKSEAEKQNQEYSRELEAVKAELERSKEHNKVLKELLSKRDEDYVELAVQFWDLTTAHEQAFREYKMKLDEATEQLENTKKVKHQMDMVPLNSLQVELEKTGEDLGSSHEKASQEEKAK